MNKMIKCAYCGADYDDMQPECPYCGTMNYKGAEAKYLGQLENVRSDMADLGNVPEQETRKEVKNVGRLIRNIFLIMALVVLLIVVGVLGFLRMKEMLLPTVERDPQENYLWKQEKFPIFDELYEKEDYEALIELYIASVNEGRPMDAWEHSAFTMSLHDLLRMEELVDRMDAGETLTNYEYEDMVYYGWKMDGIYIEDMLTEEDVEKIQPYRDHYLQDFYTRWEFTEEERAAFVEDRDSVGGYPSYDLCEKYIKKWKKENKNK